MSVQQNAFQQNAFQQAFRDAFGSAFQKRPAFQRVGGGPPPIDEGRSGYWRLFFTQMQEESLKEDAERKNPAPKVEEPVAKKKKSKKKVAPAAEVKPVDSDEAKKPLSTELKSILEPQPTTSIFTAPMVLSVSVWSEIMLLYPFFDQVCVKINIEQEAANDADIRRRLLLLLAA